MTTKDYPSPCLSLKNKIICWIPRFLSQIWRFSWYDKLYILILLHLTWLNYVGGTDYYVTIYGYQWDYFYAVVYALMRFFDERKDVRDPKFWLSVFWGEILYFLIALVQILIVGQYWTCYQDISWTLFGSIDSAEVTAMGNSLVAFATLAYDVKYNFLLNQRLRS